MILDNDPIFFRLRGPSLPPESEAPQMLGRIVQNFAQPLGGGYFPEDASKYHLRKPNETEWVKASTIFDSSRSGSIELKLSSFGGGESQSQSNSGFHLENSEIKALELHKQPEVYHKMIQEPDIRSWVMQNCKVLGQPLFMITGLLIWRDAVLSETSSDEQHSQTNLELPLGAGIAAAATSQGLIIDPDSIEDISFEQESASSHKKSQKKESAKSQVFAVQYNIVRKRKRDFFRGFEPVFEARGPRLEGDRCFDAGGDGTDNPSFGDDDDDVPPELEMDAPWTDALDEVEHGSDTRVEDVGTDDRDVSFVFMEEPETEC